MSHVTPDFDSIYSHEYWGGVPNMLRYEKAGTLGRAFEQGRLVRFNHGGIPNLETDWNIQKALARAAMQIYSGNNPEPIADGEIVGSSDDQKYALPGNILLLDSETIIWRPKNYQSQEEGTAILNEFELAASAIRLIRSGAKRETSITTYTNRGILLGMFGIKAQPHQEPLDDPRMVYDAYDRRYVRDGIGTYRRAVSVVAFFPAKDGKIGSRSATKSFMFENGKITTWLAPVSPHKTGKIGQTTNVSLSEQHVSLSRTRSAYVCARGAFEYATARSKARKHFTLGKLAPRPN